MKDLSEESNIKIINLEINSIIKKIMCLSIEEIDNLWFNSGWVDSEAKEDNRVALPNWRLNKIKEDEDFAFDSFINFVNDNPHHVLRNSSKFLSELNKKVEL